MMNEELIGMEEMMTPKRLRAYAAEALGTMLFVLVGTGAVIATTLIDFSGGSSAALVVIALAHGIGFAAAIYITANISGGHINPAVTLGMMATKKIQIAPGMLYIAAQCLGAIVATTLLYLVLRNEVGNASDFGAHGISGAVDGEGGAFLLELLLTMLLVMVIFAVAVAKRGHGNVGPLIIGLTVVAIHLVALVFTGASVNPARALGPALISDAFDSFWVYLLAPAVGGVLGALIYYRIFLQPEEEPAGTTMGTLH